ncbi:hypothetical protein HYW60_01680 [Candidatus Kaiserbacteria bacterium]|nr:hypothetical protein [Candidatus Kaiserbacteria bacterium]
MQAGRDSPQSVFNGQGLTLTAGALCGEGPCHKWDRKQLKEAAMRAFLMLIAAAAAALPFAAYAEDPPPPAVLAAEKAAPENGCHPAPDEKGVEWCWTKVRLPDGSLVGVIVRVEGDEAYGGVRLISRPPKAASR